MGRNNEANMPANVRTSIVAESKVKEPEVTRCSFKIEHNGQLKQKHYLQISILSQLPNTNVNFRFNHDSA